MLYTAEHASHLPDNIDALKRIVASRDETIARLLAEIARLKRWQYGRSSERVAEGNVGTVKLEKALISQGFLDYFGFLLTMSWWR
ncbi:transposase [Mycetohabitans rhizoxinica]|uniref:transposase n=1 Tax=Mycetohabitans rhizoxinica TaxID=412963 RepID=UPI0030CFD720